MAGTEGGATRLPIKDRFRITGKFGGRFRDSWFGVNWHTLLVLVMIVFIAFFIRSYFVYSASIDNGFLVSGGSDSYYHMRVIDHVTDTGHHLVQDPLLNYPHGMRNARPPLFDWSVAVMGMFLSSITGMVTSTAVGYTLVLSTAFWGALTVIPVYLMTRAAFGNKAGIVAAFLFAIMAGHISRSVLSTADHDSMVLFFGVWSFYFLLMALLSIKGDKWVSNWRDRKAIKGGITSYFKLNRKSVIYSALSGVSLAAVAMIWTGYAYLLVIILAYFLVQIFVNRFRDADSMGVVLTLGVILSVAFMIAAPVYYQMDYWYTWFDVPVYLFLAAMAVGLIFVVTRDYPWTLVLPSFIILAAISLLVLSLFFPILFEAILSGQGYFVKSKLYSTISEAQAPEFSTLALSFGVVTFWLSFVGLVWAALRVPKNLNPYLVFIVVWTAVSMFMAVSAARFMFNAAPAFAMTGGWIVALVVDRLRFGEIFKTISGIKGSPLTVLRKAVKIRHVLGIFFLVFLILLPNAWNAVDAAMPSELKRGYDKQVYELMKGIAKPPEYDEKNGSNWYFGAFAYSLPMPTDYWPAAWSWFREKDSQINPVVSKPAFLSWWDYGFEAINVGEHPAVADNFQNGYQLAGSVIMCQSEQDAIALFIVRTLEKTGVSNDSIAQAIRAHGVDYPKFRDIMENPARYVEIVLNNPDTYGPYDADLSIMNAKYAAARVELGKVGTDRLVDLYHELREMTGIEIGYFAIDSRLFPFNAQGGNIFYAPAKLSDRRINDKTRDPIDFFVTKAVDISGNEYDIANVTADMQIVDYKIVYQDMFYNSLLYRAFLGYGPKDIGYTTQGLPGLSGSLANLPAMQGWNLSHFRMVYRTAYYNPFPQDQVANHSSAWRAISYDEALVLRDEIDSGNATGTVDLSPSALIRGVVFMQYYEGAIIEGTVKTSSGLPFPEVWVTALDEYGIPHDTVKTDRDGKYRVIAPFGKVDIAYSFGDLDPRTQIGTQIAQTTFDITYEQAMRQETDSNGDGKFDYYINGDITLQGYDLNGIVYWDLDGDGTLSSVDVVIEGATVIVKNESRDFQQQVTSQFDGYQFVGLPAIDSDLYVSYKGHEFGKTHQILLSTGSRTVDIGVRPATISGTITTSSGTAAEGLELVLKDMDTGSQSTTFTNSTGGYTFDGLLAGNYSLEAKNSSLGLGPQLFSVDEGTGLVRNVILKSTFSISGRVTLDAVVVSNATISISSSQTRVLTRTDEKGHFDVTLPQGDYTIYCLVVRDGKEFVALSYLQKVTGPISLDMALQPGNILAGTLNDGSVRASDTELTFKSRVTGALMTTVTNSTGYFRVILPSDTYFVFAKGTTRGYWNDLIVSSSATIQLDLVSSVAVSGQVWFDSDFDGTRDEGEGVPNVVLEISDRDGRSIELTTVITGDFSVLLPSGKSYSLSCAVDGYAPHTFNFTNIVSPITQNIELVPMNRTIAGKVSFGTSLLEGVKVTFKAAGMGSVTSSTSTTSSGAFSLPLRPGRYNVVVDQNITAGSNATRYQYSAVVTISIGQDPAPLDIEVKQRVRVYGHLIPDRSATVVVTFRGPEFIELTVSKSSFDLYLLPGNYSIYAIYDQRSLKYGYLGEMEIDESSSPVDITTVQAYTVSGSLRYDGKAFISVVPVVISKSTGGSILVNTTATGYFDTVLPSGSYNVSLDYRTKTQIATKDRYVRYTMNGTMTVPSTTGNTFTLLRELDNSTVSGSIVRIGGTPASAVLEFISIKGTSINLTMDSGLGAYDASLAPGNYSLYVREAGGMGVYFAALEVLPYVNRTLNITLSSGLRMMGSTLNGGVPGSASMEFSGPGYKAIQSGPDGAYEIVLPAGEYQIRCTSSATENGMLVRYKVLTTVNLSSDLNVAIILNKTAVRGVDVQWDSKEKMTLRPGETATYNIRVVNTGNVPEVYELSLESGTWAVRFSQSEVSVDFGRENSELVTVYLTPPSNTKVVHNAQKLKVVSSTDQSVTDSVDLDASILPVYSMKLSLGDPLETTGSNYTYAITLQNAGNVDDGYNVTISNLDYLSTFGWDAQLKVGKDSFGDSATVSVRSGGSQEMTLRLTPIRTNPDPSIQVNVVATSQSSPDSYSILDMKPVMPEIQIPSGGVVVTGDDVFAEPEKVPIGTIVIAGMCVASFAVLILLSIQRGVFKRRKR